MKTYTVHFPKGTAGITADALAGAALIRDGFSWGAFLFGPFWLLWNRLWLAGFVLLVLESGFFTLLGHFAMGRFFDISINLAIMILFGLEGNSLKRWTYGRRGRPMAGIISGYDAAEAEAKMLAIGLHRMREAAPGIFPHPAAPTPFSPAAKAPPDALGLFPLLERPQ